MIDWTATLKRKNTKSKPYSNYFIFTEKELISLLVCIMLDIIEYVAFILLMPVVGDFFDVVGIMACLIMLG